MLTAEGPNKMAPSPVPVMWEQLPVTEGIFKEEITKMKLRTWQEGPALSGWTQVFGE